MRPAVVVAAILVALLAGAGRAHASADACPAGFTCFDVVVGGDLDGSGTITTTDGKIDCAVAAGVATGTCAFTYQKILLPLASRVTLSLTFVATPTPGSSTDFPRVTGGIGGSPKGDSIVDSVYSVTYEFAAASRGSFSVPVSAPFKLRPFTLSVTKSGTGTGTVTSAPAGLDCGLTCTSLVHYGDKVTLTAKPDAGSRFVGWSGACSGPDPTCTLTIKDNAPAGAVFASQGTVSVSTSGPGSVSSSPAGVDCGSRCVARFDTGTRLVLTASPDSGALFKQWTGACGSQGATCRLTVSDAVSTRAVFATKPAAPADPPPPPPPPPPASPPPPAATSFAARLLGARVVGHSLRVTLRVSAPAGARLRLLQHGFERARKLVSLRPGVHTVALSLPASLQRGGYRLTVAIRSGDRVATATALVTVKTRGG